MQGADLPILSEWQVLHDFEAEAKGVQILQKERGKAMSRYLNEGAVWSAVKRIPHITMQTRQAILEALRKVPSADVAEVRHGKWQPCYEDWRKQIEGDECSACGFQHYGTNIRNYPYCPNCGARMDGET